MKDTKLLNKGQRKNLIKRDVIDKNGKITKRRGSALAETIILIAVSLVLAIVLFYPQISNLLTNVINKMNAWVNSTLTIL